MDIDWRKVSAAICSILLGIYLLYHSHEYIGLVLTLGPVILVFVFPSLFGERNPYE